MVHLVISVVHRLARTSHQQLCACHHVRILRRNRHGTEQKVGSHHHTIATDTVCHLFVMGVNRMGGHSAMGNRRMWIQHLHHHLGLCVLSGLPRLVLDDVYGQKETICQRQEELKLIVVFLHRNHILHHQRARKTGRQHLFHHLQTQSHVFQLHRHTSRCRKKWSDEHRVIVLSKRTVNVLKKTSAKLFSLS